MSDTLQINLDEGTLWLVRQTLRRNGRPNATMDDAAAEIMAILKQSASEATEGGK